MDGWKGAEFPVKFSSTQQFVTFTFRRGEGEMMVAATIPGSSTDGLVETASDVNLPGVRAREAWVIDVLNGSEQKLVFTANSDGTTIKEMRIKDYPTLIRITN